MNVTLLQVLIKTISNKQVKLERECKYNCNSLKKTVIIVVISRRQRHGNVDNKQMAFIPAKKNKIS